MKFKIEKQRLFWWPVKVALPDPDPERAGRTITQEFKMQFSGLDRDKARALQAEIAALDDIEEREKREHELLMSVCKDWDDGVVNEDGEPVPFDKDVLTDLIGDAWFRTALYRAYGEATSGEAARRKN